MTTTHYTAEYTQKCLENNINDYKTCIVYHKLKESLFTEKIKERYNELEKLKPLIKNCKNNNLDKTLCFYSKNKNDYVFQLDYYKEFLILYKEIK